MTIKNIIEAPWVEKYRPKTFEDVVSQNLAVENLKEFVLRGNRPHMIFTGPAGTGKTSTALIIARHVVKKAIEHLHKIKVEKIKVNIKEKAKEAASLYTKMNFKRVYEVLELDISKEYLDD